MLNDIANRYPFFNRYDKPLHLERSAAFDQYGNEHNAPFFDLTSVVIISAERGDITKECVESIFKNTPEPFKIILRDVGSSEETRKVITALEDTDRNVHVIYNKRSTGTTGQRNQGIYFSRGAYLVMIDNDVLALPEWLKQLMWVAKKDERIGMVGAKLLKPEMDNVYYCECNTITLEKEGKIYGIGLTKSGQMANLHRYDPSVMRGGRCRGIPQQPC